MMPIYEICMKAKETKSYNVFSKLSEVFEDAEVISVVKVSESTDVPKESTQEEKQ